MVLTRLILGLLTLAPMTGYDVKKHVDSSIRHFWAADKAQVYRALATLVTDGHATVEVIPQQGRPDRQEHRITDAGRRALREWLASPLPPHADRDPFLARLFFAGELDRTEVATLLTQRRAQTTQLLAALTTMRSAPPTTDRATYLRTATLENGLAHARAELEWLDAVERNLP
ncbi:PadR family transcriptional regulator [Georgenia yuyongxinii]|uniref:PadR family transcriptional regulator n=1 Tax=Georgenia yuyongxinii TaxID=2589797 RepID=A0A552WV15_9MICO|nr:PadR family transcriptional regulator [Georgenia yuyongxinii]TRW46632.1 PadR family transcriptional regulator [Georgenia yuyongxinii]